MNTKYSEINDISQVDLSTRLTKNVTLNMPLLSRCNTGNEAIQLARQGSIGILPLNCHINEFVKVKQAQNIVIKTPITIDPDANVDEAMKLLSRHKIGCLLVKKDNKIEGILTERDIRFVNNNVSITEICTKLDHMIMATPKITMSEAKETFRKYKIKYLPIIEPSDNTIQGLICAKDIIKRESFPEMSVNSKGRLRVIGTVNEYDQSRIKSLVEVETDVIYVHTNYGHSLHCENIIRRIQEEFPDTDLVAGNVISNEGIEFINDLGVETVFYGNPIAERLGFVREDTEEQLHDAILVADFGVTESEQLLPIFTKNFCFAVCDNAPKYKNDLQKISGYLNIKRFSHKY